MYRRNRHGWVKHLDFMMLDLLCMHVAYLLAYFLRQGLNSNPYNNRVYLSMLLCMSLSNIAVALGLNTYKNVLKRGYMEEFGISLRQVLLVILIAIGYLFVVKEGDNASRFIVLFSGVLYLGIAFVTRVVWKQYLRRRMENDKSRSLLIVTSSQRAESVIRQLQLTGYNRYYIAGLVLLDEDAADGRNPEKGPGGNPQEICGVRVVAEQKNAAEYVCRKWIDEVLIDMPTLEESPRDLLDKFMEMGVVVHIVLTGVFNPYGQSQFVERMGGMTVLTSSIRWVDSSSMIIKRLMDILIGAVGTVLCALLTVIFGPLIYIASPGPIFFRQIRVGKNGKRFKMYKFRSMYPDAEARKAELMAQNNIKDGMMFKLDYDPRIIGCKMREDGTIKKGIGNFIRDWSIDEFPQFINILRGDMSAVGTRPPTVDEWEKYELHHRQRLSIKPGLTGLWQVNGRSNITDFEEVVKLDAEYIADWSLGKDIKILLKTVKIVFLRIGAK